MNDNTAQPVHGASNYAWALNVYENNGNVVISYSTTCPLQCSGNINLIAQDANGHQKILAAIPAKPEGGIWQTDRPWGNNYACIWNDANASKRNVNLVTTPLT